MRKLTISNVTTKANRTATVSVKLTEGEKGDEMAMSFSVKFDPKVLSFKEFTPGSGNPKGAEIYQNADLIADGLIGFGVYSDGHYIDTPPKINEVVKLKFKVAKTTAPAFYPLTFSNTPTPQSVAVGEFGTALGECEYINGGVTVAK